MEPVSASPPYRCPTCEGASVKPRNLVVFIDGTSNKPGDKSTNVWKLYERVISERVISESPKGSEVEQRKYYLKGIGAYDVAHLHWLSRKKKEIYSGLEMAFAWNAEKNVKDAYSWLAGVYRQGDRIYLFGFSRGAFQVRALASMIHEVGLVKEKEQTESAYDHYLAIDPYKPETRKAATQFKKGFCWQGLRIHFVGVWDTVSSLGLIKKDVHVTASASVTNACHFRHALALDERRVKFIPEYFLEMNAHHSKIASPRSAISNVEEVWFAGSHSDVGGTDRPRDQMHTLSEDDDPGPHTVHAGNVPLIWMRREAAAKGLVFDLKEFAWDPKDVNFGRRNTMTSGWGIVEIFPIRHQVSFSGTGKHKRRWHLFRPRSVIPGQQIHPSILSGDVYTPRATLEDGIDIPTTRASDGLWATEPPDAGATTRLLSLLLSDQQPALESLEKVLFLLDSSNGQISIPRSQWSEIDILSRSDFAKFALTVICGIPPASEELVRGARASLSAILSSPDHLDFQRTLYILRFSARHRTLGRHFIGHDEVIGPLMLALEQSAMSSTENTFSLVMDSLRYLIDDDQLRGVVVDQLGATSDGAETRQSRLSVALEVKSPNQLTASLKMIASFAQFQQGPCEELKPKIFELAKKERGPVGSAAVEALVALMMPLTRDIHFSNILGYLGNALPRLDAEVGSTTSADNFDNLPAVRLVNGSEEVMRKLVLTIKSRDAHERTAATLTLLKLCRNSIIQKSCSEHKVLDIFMRQLEQKGTSLLAAYALKTCLDHGMSPSNFPRAAQLIVAMLDKGWFDDAVGRVEGCEIFRGLMKHVNLRQQVIELGIVATSVKKLEVGKHHEVRMSLLCLDILEECLCPHSGAPRNEEDPLGLASIVTDSVTRLKDKDKKVQKKGVKTLAALAQTSAGEGAIKLHLIEIVKMLPSSDRPSVPHSQLFGPAAALYGLSKNETLREQIKASPEFKDFKNLHPKT